MLLTSFIFCSLLLLLARVAASRGGGWRKGLVFSGLAFPVYLTTCVMPPLFFLYVLLLFIFPWGKDSPRRERLFPVLSLAAFAIVFAVPCGYALLEWIRVDGLRREYPLEAMDERVPEPKSPDGDLILSDRANRQLESVEQWIGDIHQHSFFGVSGPGGGPGLSRSNYRSQALQRLHEDVTHDFVNSPGFGVGRMMPIAPTRESILRSIRVEPRPVIPQASIDIVTNAAPAEKFSSREPDEPLFTMHHHSLLNFVNSNTFGYVKGNRQAAGFESHQFQFPPHSPKPWRIETLELVGLLLKAEPAVYVSPNLPRMDDLRDAPARPMDTFESTALGRLRQGEEMVIEGTDSRWRMLGALRNAKQCAACHGGQRGELLGAFSYVLRKGE